MNSLNKYDMNYPITMTYEFYVFALAGTVAYIRDANSPNWKPTLISNMRKKNELTTRGIRGSENVAC